MTTATVSPFSYTYDPSGAELRRALLAAPARGVHLDRASAVLACSATVTLALGVLRLIVA